MCFLLDCPAVSDVATLLPGCTIRNVPMSLSCASILQSCSCPHTTRSIHSGIIDSWKSIATGYPWKVVDPLVVDNGTPEEVTPSNILYDRFFGPVEE